MKRVYDNRYTLLGLYNVLILILGIQIVYIYIISVLTVPYSRVDSFDGVFKTVKGRPLVAICKT